jgi:hypothetical protein
MKTFTLPDGNTIECRSENTRYGFRHLAELNGTRYKACYYNRTWEQYDFQTVAHGVIDKYYDKITAIDYKQVVDKVALGQIDREFGFIGAIAKLGEVICDNIEDKNKWKARMLKAGLSGLDFPDDFDSLPEEEKERRLNEVIRLTSEKGG